MKLNNLMLTKSLAKCHHMVNGGSQSCIVSCVRTPFLTTAWFSSAFISKHTACGVPTHQHGPTKPQTQEQFIICHDFVRNELDVFGVVENIH